MPQSEAYLSPPPALRESRGWLWRAIGLAYLRLAGWRIEGAFPVEPGFVAIVAPHTSNWDFALGMAMVLGIELRVSWLGKHSIFKAPFRRLLQRMGGIPVDRRTSHGVVGACTEAFAVTPAMVLALAPEGTRKGASQWRSGFYQIATAAGVPILPVGFDYREHVIRLMPAFTPSGDLEQDLPRIRALFSQVHGLRDRLQGA